MNWSEEKLLNYFDIVDYAMLDMIEDVILKDFKEEIIDEQKG